MSRFDRRLKGNSGGGSSPRPGVSTCKIRNNNTKMLSGFINVVEKNVENASTNLNEKNTLIQEVSTTSYNENNNKINETIQINETLKIAISQTKDSKLKQLLIHELRLNTLEMNLDCLTELKCEQISKEQEEHEEELSLVELKKRVREYSGIISNIEEKNLHIKKDIEIFKTNVSELQNHQAEISANLEKLNRKSQNQESFGEKINIIETQLQHLEENITDNDTVMHLEKVNDKIERITLIFNELLEKLKETNPDEFNMMELI